MGSVFSSGSNTWDIQLHNRCGELIKLNAHYDANEPQTIRILGPVSLECTVEVNNCVIEMEGPGHRITVRGNNNTIRVDGPEAQVRVEGNENKLVGQGTGAELFTNHHVQVGDIVVAKKDSCNAADAPPSLELLDDAGNDTSAPTTNNNKERIRITYRARVDGGGGGDASPSGSSSNNGDINASSSGDQDKGRVKRAAEDSNDDNNNEPDNKRSRND